jgi:hypothetical protein
MVGQKTHRVLQRDIRMPGPAEQQIKSAFQRNSSLVGSSGEAGRTFKAQRFCEFQKL